MVKDPGSQGLPAWMMLSNETASGPAAMSKKGSVC